MCNVCNDVKSKYFSEREIDSALNDIINPFLDECMESGFINGANNQSLYYETYKVSNPKANIVLSHGLIESIKKYRELIYYFVKEGYSVYAIEHRGHAKSGCLANLDVVDETQVNVEKFDYYVEDFKRYIDNVVVPDKEDKKLFLFGHSMGGGIGALFLERYPDYFDVALLNCPMMEINTGGMPSAIAKIITNVSMMMGAKDRYVIGNGPFSEEPNLEVSATSCESRYMNYHKFLLDNTIYKKGGVSYNWLHSAFKATKEIVENAHKVKIPVMLCQAGKDTFVSPNGQNKFAKKASNCELKIYKDSKHEIYWERDCIMHPYLDDVFSFYNKHL